jgi:two-component system invasion response regulator UvrY
MATLLENPTNKSPHELLSDREYQTLLLITSGKTVSQIAEELSLSIPTISTYRARILEKMNLKNSAELTHYAVTNHLI